MSILMSYVELSEGKTCTRCTPWYRQLVVFSGEDHRSTALINKGFNTSMHIQPQDQFGNRSVPNILIPLFWWVVWKIFPYIGTVIVPTDELIFFRGVGSTWLNHQPVLFKSHHRLFCFCLGCSLKWGDWYPIRIRGLGGLGGAVGIGLLE